jgi:ribosome-associated heat shock protein Hsp15
MQEKTVDVLSTVRLDKWLWAARFFKTRSLASTAILNGRVKINGDRCKPAKLLRVGDKLEIHSAPFDWHLLVLSLSERRGSPAVASALFQESEESQDRREELRRQLKAARGSGFLENKARPTKKDRRALINLKKKNI